MSTAARVSGFGPWGFEATVWTFFLGRGGRLGSWMQAPHEHKCSREGVDTSCPHKFSQVLVAMRLKYPKP